MTGELRDDACGDCRHRAGHDPYFWQCRATGQYVSTVRDQLNGRPCPYFEYQERVGLLRRIWRWLW